MTVVSKRIYARLTTQNKILYILLWNLFSGVKRFTDYIKVLYPNGTRVLLKLG